MHYALCIKIKVDLSDNLYSLTHIVLNVEFDMSKNDIIMKKLKCFYWHQVIYS